jgi:hypothetical protein
MGHNLLTIFTFLYKLNAVAAQSIAAERQPAIRQPTDGLVKLRRCQETPNFYSED